MATQNEKLVQKAGGGIAKASMVQKASDTVQRQNFSSSAQGIPGTSETAPQAAREAHWQQMNMARSATPGQNVNPNAQAAQGQSVNSSAQAAQRQSVNSSARSSNGLDNYRSQAQSLLAKQRQQSQMSADASMQKLMKYLPQQTKGYSIGMTETAKIAANNSYMRQMAQADMDYAEKSMELDNYVRQERERLEDKEYQRKWNEDEREYNRGRDTEMDKRYYEERDYSRERDAVADERYEDERDYARGRDAVADARYEDERDYSREQDATSKQKAEWGENYNNALGIVEGGTWNTAADLRNYVESLEGKVSPEQYGNLMQYVITWENDHDQQEADAEYEKKNKYKNVVSSGEVFGPPAPQGNTTATSPKTVVRRTATRIYYSDGTSRAIK